MMTDQEIVQLVLQTIQKNNNSSRSSAISSVQPIAPPTIVYAGLILIDGTIAAPAAGAYPGTLPTGWTVDHAGTGDYIMTHNLNTTTYACTVSPLGTTTACSISISSTQLEFGWYDTKTQALTDTPFMFIVTVVNNRKTTAPTYKTN